MPRSCTNLRTSSETLTIWACVRNHKHEQYKGGDNGGDSCGDYITIGRATELNTDGDSDKGFGEDNAGDYTTIGRATELNEDENNNKKGDWNMSKKAYGVVIATEKGVKVMGMFQKQYPTKNEIKACLRFESEQELNAIQTRNSGWRTSKGLKDEMSKVADEYKAAIKAINNNKFKIKILA